MIQTSLNDRLNALAVTSAEKLLTRMQLDSLSAKEMTGVLKVAAEGLGLGRPQQNNGVNLYVVNAPPVAPSAQQWAQQARGDVIENPPNPGV